MRATRPPAKRHQQPARHGGPDARCRAVAKELGRFCRREQRRPRACRDRRRDLATRIDVHMPARRHEWRLATGTARCGERRRGTGDAREHRELGYLARDLVRRPRFALRGGHRASQWRAGWTLVLVSSVTRGDPIGHRRSQIAIARPARHGVNEGRGLLGEISARWLFRRWSAR